jgi:hypothetical protein
MSDYATSGELIDYVEVRQCVPPPTKSNGNYYIVCEFEEDTHNMGMRETCLAMKRIPDEHVEYIKKMVIKKTLTL